MENDTQKTSATPQVGISELENKLKEAFKAGDEQKSNTLIAQIKTLDSQSHVVKMIQKKLDEKAKVKSEQQKAKKVGEYENMLRILYKQRDHQKIKSLAQELKAFDPTNKTVDRWMAKANKLEKGGGFLNALFARKEKKEAASKAEALTSSMDTTVKNELKAPQKPDSVTNSKPVQTPILIKANRPLSEKTEGETLNNPKFVPPSQQATEPIQAEKAMVNTSVPRQGVARVSIDPIEKKDTTKTVSPVSLNSTKKELVSAHSTPALSVKTPQVEQVRNEEKPAGNTFTKMFGSSGGTPKEKERSIIDQIVAKTEEADHATSSSLNPKKEPKSFNWLGFAKLFANFTALFIVFTAGFLYVTLLDKENNVLGLVGVSANTGSALETANEQIAQKRQQEASLNESIRQLEAGYNDPRLGVASSIVSQRVDWPDTFQKIDEVTESVFEYYEFFGYVVYNNFSLDADGRTIRVTGTLSDPTGFNLTGILKLAEAFETYPNLGPEDPTKPYFEEFQELSTLSKSFDSDSGRYVSNFQFTFSLPDGLLVN